jgi:hypothetical protein
MAFKRLLVLILAINLFNTCQGGLLGAAAGLAVCTNACHLGYITCVGGGAAGAGKKSIHLKKFIPRLFRFSLCDRGIGIAWRCSSLHCW